LAEEERNVKKRLGLNAMATRLRGDVTLLVNYGGEKGERAVFLVTPEKVEGGKERGKGRSVTSEGGRVKNIRNKGGTERGGGK